MESQPQNPEFRNNPENLHLKKLGRHLMGHFLQAALAVQLAEIISY